MVIISLTQFVRQREPKEESMYRNCAGNVGNYVKKYGRVYMETDKQHISKTDTYPKLNKHRQKKF